MKHIIPVDAEIVELMANKIEYLENLLRQHDSPLNYEIQAMHRQFDPRCIDTITLRLAGRCKHYVDKTKDGGRILVYYHDGSSDDPSKTLKQCDFFVSNEQFETICASTNWMHLIKKMVEEIMISMFKEYRNLRS